MHIAAAPSKAALLLPPAAHSIFVFVAYQHWPPRAWTRAQCQEEADAVHSIPPMSTDVIKALRRALTMYHPDKNRKDIHGAEWAEAAEELAKLSTVLLENYRRRIKASTEGVSL